jgi:hypothetical protein
MLKYGTIIVISIVNDRKQFLEGKTSNILEGNKNF